MKQDNGLSPPHEMKRSYHSLSRSLVLWFLLLALLPLTLVSFISYQQARSSLTSATIDNLEKIAEKKCWVY
ncbi:hypothetical protein A9Q81_25750 [Gammaproteobacteria bacterium 42_54_T18]|nr:hypothetical protein A9Q81_25750 [Gammaproteobacteria bacterium 42_54_T18]